MTPTAATGGPARGLLRRTVHAGGLAIRYGEAGAGPAVLLIPSGFLNAASYRGILLHLAPWFRIVAPEMPGTGASGSPERLWGFEDYADWFPAFLDAVGLRRVLVVGHSDSGGVGLLMAARHPGRLSGLVLVDSVGAFPGASWARLLWGRIRDAVVWERALSLRLAAPILGNLVLHPRQFFRHVGLSTETGPLEIAPRVAVPTLIAWGRHDQTLPPACAERLHAAIPDARLRWIEASHDWLFQRPEVLAQLVGEFAKELSLLE